MDGGEEVGTLAVAEGVGGVAAAGASGVAAAAEEAQGFQLVEVVADDVAAEGLAVGGEGVGWRVRVGWGGSAGGHECSRSLRARSFACQRGAEQGLAMVPAGAGLDAFPPQEGEIVAVHGRAEQRGDEAELPPGEGFVVRGAAVPGLVARVQHGVPDPVIPHAEEDLPGLPELLIPLKHPDNVDVPDAEQMGSAQDDIAPMGRDARRAVAGLAGGGGRAAGLRHELFKLGVAMDGAVAEPGADNAAVHQVFQSLQDVPPAAQDGQGGGEIAVAITHDGYYSYEQSLQRTGAGGEADLSARGFLIGPFLSRAFFLMLGGPLGRVLGTSRGGEVWMRRGVALSPGVLVFLMLGVCFRSRAGVPALPSGAGGNRAFLRMASGRRGGQARSWPHFVL